MAIQINLIELAWAAGFWDGEGCTNFSRSYYWNSKGKHPRYRICAAVGQTNNRYPIHRFKAAVQIGNVSGPDSALKTSWRVSTFEEVQAVIAMLWKFLCPAKRNQYKEVLKKWKAFKWE